mgnify:FL=1
MKNSKLKKIIESLIFSSSSPISIKELRNFFSDEKISLKLLEELISELQIQYLNSGVNLKKVSTGYRFQVSEECNEWVTNF